jgi:glycosyltransferase involved in cell wall biosynthesis
LTFAKHFLNAFKEEVALAGLSQNKEDLGMWVKRNVNGIEVDYFGYLHIKKSDKKPLIPLRLRNYLALKKYKKQILLKEYKNVLVQAPDTFLAICKWNIPNLCYRFAGIENPLAISRYRIGRFIAFLFDRIFLPKLKYAKKILAAADNQAISELISRSKGSLCSESIIQFPTRINIEIFQKKPKELCREKIQAKSDEIIVVTTGRLAEFKGWKFLIDSFVYFKNTKPYPKLYFIGNGEDREKIINYINSLQMQSCIKLLGYQSPENIADYLNAADLFIMGSFKEGWSTSLIEAIACGVPVCVTNFSSAKEIVQESLNGFVVDKHDEKLFSEAMMKTTELARNTLPITGDIERYSVAYLKRDILKFWPLLI